MLFDILLLEVWLREFCIWLPHRPLLVCAALFDRSLVIHHRYTCILHVTVKLQTHRVIFYNIYISTRCLP